MIRLSLSVFFCLFAVLPAFAQVDMVTVDDLLQKSSKALQEKSYKGRFTYEFGNVLESLEIVHAVKDGVEYERIHHLNGNTREFLRAGRKQDCVSVGSKLLRGGLVATHTGAVSLSQNYHFYIRGDDRIAGRSASVIQALPKDEFRYGMTLAVDQASSLPLMSLITSSSSHRALERFQFVDIEVSNDIKFSDLEPSSGAHQSLNGTDLCEPNKPPSGRWNVNWVPAGFLLSDSGVTATGDEVFTFTDGLASFSLFISKVNNPQEMKKGVARRGATVAMLAGLSAENSLFSIVFVGEVPIITAKRVVSSIQYY